MMATEFIAYPSKSRLLLIVAGGLALTVTALWIAGVFGSPPEPGMELFGWLAAVFFALCSLALGRRLFERDAELRIDKSGILYRRWSNFVIPWSEIADVGTWSHQGQKVIVLALHHPDLFPSSTMMGKLAGMNRALTGGDISISLTGTDRSFDEAMAAIDAFAPVAAPTIH